jgi:hypothetical protein
VQKGVGLTDAELFVKNTPVSIDGTRAAADHYFRLHAVPELVPQLLTMYKKTEAEKFGTIYTSRIARVKNERFGIGLDFDEATTILSMRDAFDTFGKYMYKANNESSRRVGTSLQLYARLPMYSRGKEGHMFYPAAALPCKAVLRGYFERWGAGWSVPGLADCLAPVSHSHSTAAIQLTHLGV